MKKIFTLLVAAVMAVGASAQSLPAEKTWNFSNFEQFKDATEAKEVDGLTMYGTTTGKISIDGSKKTVDGVKYTQRFKTGGAGACLEGNVLSRMLAFDVPGSCTVKAVATSSNASDTRTLVCGFGNWDAATQNATVEPGDPIVVSFNYSGEATRVFLYSKAGGLNFYAVSYESNDQTAVETVDVDANAPVVYYNLQGVQVENPENGIFIRKQGAKTTKVVIK